MKRWMIYLLIAAVAVAIVLIIALPVLLNKEPKLQFPVHVVNQGEKLSANLKPFVIDEKIDEVVLELVEGPGTISGFSYVFEPGFSYEGEVRVSIRATDKKGKSSQQEMLINVVRVNRPPEIDTSPIVVREGETVTIDLNSLAVDPDGEELEFSVQGPGELHGSAYIYSPGYSDSGKTVLRVLAKDPNGNETARDIELEVIDVNAPPVLQLENQIVNEGEVLSVDISSKVVDEDNDKVVLSLEEGPGEITEGVFTYEPSYSDSGTETVRIKASDGSGNDVFSSFEILVIDVNRPPKSLLSDINVNEGESLSFDLLSRVVDPDGDNVTFSLEGPGEIVDGSYIYNPDYSDAGDKSIVLILEDEKGATNTASFMVRVNDVNRPPQISIPDQSVKEGEQLKIYLKGFISDPDGDEVTFEIADGPGFIEDDHYLFTPDFDSEGIHEVTLTAKDNKGLESVGFFKVTVENVNRSPVTLSPSINTSIMESFTLDLDLGSLFVDPDGDDLQFEVEGYGIVVDNSYQYSPGYNDKGEKVATVTATDPYGLSDSLVIRIDVKDRNRNPESSIEEMKTSIHEGSSLKIDLRPLFSDPDGDELIYSLSGIGEIEGSNYSYSPGYDEAGEKNVIVTASDNNGGSLSLPIIISVIDVNRPPQISIPDQSVKEGEQLKIYLKGFISDPDGDEVTFEIADGPGFIEDDHYLFTPDFDSEGIHEVTLTAKDNKGLESVGFFKVTVENVNRSPVTLSPSINTSIMESFTLDLDLGSLFVDPDGDDLQFELQGIGSISANSYIYTPGFNDSGEKTATVTAIDSNGSSQSLPIRIEVRNLNRPPDVFLPDCIAEAGKEFSLYLRAFATDPDGDALRFNLISGPGEVVGDRYFFLPERADIGEREVILEVSDELGMKTKKGFRLEVKASEKVVRISYALPLFSSENVRIVAGEYEIVSDRKQAVIKTDWEFNFDEIQFYSINESEETLIGTAIFDSTDDSLNRKIYSPSGDYVGNIILVTE
ncbi:Ig-like domain-containing protein [Mesotoga prima]|uniref:Ig-like domain-containing protein n=2 Tax=Mesotoga prima TaxID=1184387 RepID=UPI002FD9F58B